MGRANLRNSMHGYVGDVGDTDLRLELVSADVPATRVSLPVTTYTSKVQTPWTSRLVLG